MSLTRRSFLQTTGLAAGAALLPTGLVRAAEASAPAAGKTLRLAIIGAGGQGGSDLGALTGHKAVQLVAACDPDRHHREGTAKAYGKRYGEIKTYSDYRKMFTEMKGQIDGVLVATPDHMHAPIGLLAMSLGIHVYGQKPLARTIGECRAMTEMAAKMKVITQMGIQIHSSSGNQTTRKWIQEGVVGKVKEVHSGIGNKPWGGMVKYTESAPPEWMDWDTYLGIAATQPWNDQIHPMNWRKWVAFGSGIQGDMACHVFDPVYMAVGLTKPIEVTSLGPTPPDAKFFAYDCHVKYLFPKNNITAGDVEVHWRNGNITAPKGLHPGIEAPLSGALIIGDKGALAIPHMGSPTVVDSKGVKLTKEQLPAPAPGVNHYHAWVDAVLTNDQSKATAGFAYGGPMTEAVLMGLAINHTPNKTFKWDADNCKFSGEGAEVEKCNALVHPQYRAGWTAPGM